MTYGRPDTTQSLSKKTTKDLTDIFNTFHNTSQKNTLLKSSPMVSASDDTIVVTDSPTNVVITIETSSGDIPLPLTTPGLGGFIVGSITGDVTIMFVGDIPTDKFDFTIQLGFVHEEVLDEEGEPINPTVTFPDSTVGLPDIDSNTGNTTKLVFNTLDRGLTWSVTNSIGIFDGLDIGATLAGIRAWIDGLPDATMDNVGFLKVETTDLIATKVMKGLVHETASFTQFIATGVLEWLDNDEGIIGKIYDVWKDHIEGVLEWIDGLPDATEGNDILFLRVQDGDNIAIKILKGIANEGQLFLDTIVSNVTSWLAGESSGLLGILYRSITDTIGNVLVWIDNLPTSTEGNDIEFLRVQADDHIAVKILKGIANDLPEFIRTVAEGVKGWLNGDESGILGVLYRSISTTLIGVFEWIDSTFVGPIREFTEYLKVEYTAAAGNNVITKSLNTIRSIFGDIGALILDWITSNASAVFSLIQDSLLATYDWIAGGISGIVTSVTDAIGEFTANIVRWLQDDEGIIGKIYDAWTDSNLVSYISGFVSDPLGTITTALGTQWNKVTNLISEVGSSITTWLGNQGSIILGVVDGAYTWLTTNLADLISNIQLGLGVAWDWLVGLAVDIRTGINYVGTLFRGGVSFATLVASSIASGVTEVGETLSNIGSAVNDLLFGGLLPEAFADEHANTQITASINSEDDDTIGGKIKDTFATFWSDFDSTVDTVGQTLDEILAGIATAIGGGTQTPSTGGADRALSNLEDVAINKALNFDNDTGGGNMSRSIGYTNDDLYLKLPDKDNSVFIQGNDRNDNSEDDVTLLSIGQKKLRLYDQTNSLEGEANGTMAVYGDTVLMKVGGVVKNFAAIGTGGEIPDIVTDNTLIIRNSSSSESATGVELDTEFGTERGTIGVWCPNSVSADSDARDIFVYLKSQFDWFGHRMTRRVDNSRTLVGTAYGTSTARKRIKWTTSGNDDSTLALAGNVEGRIYLHQESDDADDGTFGVVSGGGLYVVDHGDAREVSATDDAGQTIPLLDTIPTITLSTITSAVLNTAFGSGEGSMGFNRNSRDLFIKINGYWWYMDLFL